MTFIAKVAVPAFLALAANAHAVGLLPTPVLNDVRISSDVIADPLNGYTYSYAISNPAGNTGEITNIRLDVTAGQSGNGMVGNTFGLTIPLGPNQFDFGFLVQRLQALNASISTPGFLQQATIVPFGQNVPPGWNGGLGMGGFASFSVKGGAPGILPGASLTGFQLRSFGVPTIRTVHIIPFWMHVVDDHDAVTEADMQAAGQLEQSIVFQTVTLGPSGVSYASFAHWDQLRDDLAKAIQLGWIIDNVLANTLTNQLAFAREALDARDFFTAKTRLEALLDTIDQSGPGQTTREGFLLVSLNAHSLFDNARDNEIEPKITLSPKTASLSVGGQQNFTATLIDLANGSRPIPDIPIRFRVDSGPNAGNLDDTQTTDAQGDAKVSYLGTQPGTDRVIASAEFFGGEVSFDDTGLVVWSGGTDLVVPLFIPPLLMTAGGRTFFVTEETQNIGNIAAQQSVTRYFIFPDQFFDTATARPVGERTIPALQPGQSSSINQQPLTIPSDLPEGTYFLAACADADRAVSELDENNNCSFISVQGRQSFVVPMDTPNRPLICNGAIPSVATLWPPDHKLQSVLVLGLASPTGSPISVVITRITQDEPMNGLGDGDTSPDGFGIGTSSAMLRAERSGIANGRVYTVSFFASDSTGSSCSGNVAVGVPHDQGKGRVPIDDGQNYDSTAP
jgi:CARDB